MFSDKQKRASITVFPTTCIFSSAISSLSKAFKQDPQLLLTQRRAGMMLAVVALLSLIGLVMIKPVF